jgi:SAM-dependent methyltransferase
MAAPDHWFEPLAEHLGSAYLRYSFTKGTVQEVDALVELLGLRPGHRVLDVGCGPGRHAHELGRRGIAVHGIDISQRFVDIAAEAAVPGTTFERLDARALLSQASFDASFDAAVSLCQGAFGLLGSDDETLQVLRGMAQAVRPGGRVVVSAFSAYFSVKYQVDADFDAASGVAHEHTELRDEQGRIAPAELWTTCFTPRELRLLAAACGLQVDAVHSVEPGAYGALAPTIESPEFLLLATRAG